MSVEQLIFEIIAKDADASAAFDRFRNKVNQTSGSLNSNSKALDANAKALDKNKQSNVSALGALLGTATAFLPITVGAAAAGVGITAFGALAVPSVRKVVTALTAKGGLAESWLTLDNRQRNAALGIQALGDDYADLARKMEPQVFQVFNQGLMLAHSLLGPTGQLARTSGQGISDFLATFSASSGLQHFISFLSTVARPAIGLLGSDVTHIFHTVFSLLEGFGGSGLLELRALTGVFTALDDSISFLSQHAPGLTSAALAIGGIALALSKLGLLSGALKITGISSIAGQMSGFVGATKDASLAEKGMLATTTALGSVTPWGWAAVGVAALTGLVLWLGRTKTAADETVSSIEAQNKATGFNTAGYLAAAAAIGKVNDQQRTQTVQLVNLHAGVKSNTVALGSYTGQTADYYNAQQSLISGAREQASFLGVLESKYKLTGTQAAALATAAGVLTDKNGKLTLGFAASITKAEAYANANLAARNPVMQLTADVQAFGNQTLTATQRQTALTDALKLFFDPAVKADQDIITMKNDQVALATALTASGGKTGLLTQAQRDARSAFQTYINDVATAAQDAFAATGRTGSYTKIIHDALPTLYAAAAGNKTLRGEIQKLIDTMQGLTPEKVSISVGARGTWSVSQFQAPGGVKVPTPGGAARGMFVAQGRPGVDDQLILAQRGELVVPAGMVAGGAVDHLRGRIPGFADGGVVGGFRGTLPGLGGWLRAEDSATLLAISNSVALATLAGIRAAQRSGFAGTSGNAIVNFAEQFVGRLPYVWGGTSLVTGADCAGFTEAVYAHFGMNIPRTSEQQYAFMQRSQDRPGALVFFVSPAGGPPPGHVGISMGNGMMVNAAGTQFGTIISSAAGNMGFGVMPTGGDRGGTAHPTSFDSGGYLPPGLSLAYNGTGRPEPVGRMAGGSVIINITVQVGHGTSPRQAAKEIADILNQGATAGIRLRKSILSANG